VRERNAGAPWAKTLSEQDLVTLLAVERGKVEACGQLQGIELDPVLERFARKPY
jgi:hypothetical protein